MTLQQFINKCGSQESAAQELGVTVRTISRWAQGRSLPRGLSRKALEDKGISHD